MENKYAIPVIHIPHSKVGPLHSFISTQHNHDKINPENLYTQIISIIHGQIYDEKPKCWAVFSSLYAIWHNVPETMIQKHKESILLQCASDSYFTALRLINDVIPELSNNDGCLKPLEIFYMARDKFSKVLQHACGCHQCKLISSNLYTMNTGLYRLPNLMPHSNNKCQIVQILNNIVHDFILHKDYIHNITLYNLVKLPHEFVDFGPEYDRPLSILLTCIYLIQFYFILMEIIVYDIRNLKQKLENLWSVLTDEDFNVETVNSKLNSLLLESPLSYFLNHVTAWHSFDSDKTLFDRSLSKTHDKGPAIFEQINKILLTGNNVMSTLTDKFNQLDIDFSDSETISEKQMTVGNNDTSLAYDDVLNNALNEPTQDNVDINDTCDLENSCSCCKLNWGSSETQSEDIVGSFDTHSLSPDGSNDYLCNIYENVKMEDYFETRNDDSDSDDHRNDDDSKDGYDIQCLKDHDLTIEYEQDSDIDRKVMQLLDNIDDGSDLENEINETYVDLMDEESHVEPLDEYTTYNEDTSIAYFNNISQRSDSKHLPFGLNLDTFDSWLQEIEKDDSLKHAATKTQKIFQTRPRYSDEGEDLSRNKNLKDLYTRKVI